MLYMVIEKFKDGNAKAVYQRFDEHGRMMPDGLKYIDSWIDVDLGRCFQLMECDDLDLFQEWIANWDDLVEFEVVSLITSAEARERVATPADSLKDLK